MLLENWYSFLCLTIENQGEVWTILEEKESFFFQKENFSVFDVV